MFKNMTTNMSEPEMWKRLHLLRPLTKGWPGVPDDPRIDSAIQDVQAHGLHPEPQEFPDAQIISDFLETGRFQRWAAAEMKKQTPQNLTADNLLEWMMTFGLAGCSPSTIALVLDSSAGPTQKPRITFDRIPRHPDWMGFCPELRNLKGADCLIMESSIIHHEPAIVLGMNAARGLCQNSEKITSNAGKPKNLEELLTHHGVTETAWCPRA